MVRARVGRGRRSLGGIALALERRRADFAPNIHRVAELIDDFAPLRDLPSFQAMDESLCGALLLAEGNDS